MSWCWIARKQTWPLNKINGSTNILFYNTVIIVHYTLRTKREVEQATYSLSHPFRCQ